MEDRIRAYVESLFRNARATSANVELKEELILNLTEKFASLVADGKTEEAAYNLTIASIGDISQLIDEHVDEPQQVLAAQQNDLNKKNATILRAVAVALYILCAVPILVLESTAGVILTLIIVAIATAIIMYASFLTKQSNQLDITVAEDFKEWREKNSSRKEIYKVFETVIMTIATAIYVIVSFKTGAWHITWIIFLIASAISSIAKILITNFKK